MKKLRKINPLKNWKTLYGWFVALVSDGVLDADGKPTSFTIQKRFTHNPGDIVVSRSQKRTNGPFARYMVQADHSLRRI